MLNNSQATSQLQGEEHRNMAAEEDKVAQSSALKTQIAPFLITVAITAFSQLLAFLGAGKPDGFIPELTVMQSVAIISFGINFIIFIPAYVFQTEKFYDLTGSITYLTCTWYSFLSGSFNGTEFVIQTRPLAVSIMVSLWALRLGYFLFTRILKDGKDGRFDEIKPKFFVYLMTWGLQGLWVYLTAFCAFIINSSTAPDELLVSDYIGFGIWLIFWAVEITADNQKSNWRAKPENRGKFIDVGLWYYSRHPNYLGEIVLWFGIFVIAAGNLVDTQWIAVIAPIFEFCLIYFVSGVNKLEKRGDEKFGHMPEYAEYKRTTNVFFIAPKGWTCGIQTEVKQTEQA